MTPYKDAYVGTRDFYMLKMEHVGDASLGADLHVPAGRTGRATAEGGSSCGAPQLHRTVTHFARFFSQYT